MRSDYPSAWPEPSVAEGIAGAICVGKVQPMHRPQLPLSRREPSGRIVCKILHSNGEIFTRRLCYVCK